MSRAPRKPSIAQRGPGLPGWARLLGSLSGSAILWIGTGVAVAFGLPLIQGAAENLAQEPTRIHWEKLPEWQNSPGWSGILKDVEATIHLLPEAAIYDKNVCEWVATNALKSPWIREVKHVWKQLDGVVRVQAEFRTPTALLQSGNDYYLVDDTGVRLPLPEGAVQPGDWIIIRGVAAKPPDPGLKWEGDDLAAGLKMLAFLSRAAANNRMPFRSEVAALDVSNRNRRRDANDAEIKLTLRSGRPEIRWGLPPGEEAPIEQPASRKLSVLTELYGPSGRFPDYEWLDIRSPDRVLHPEK